MHGRIIALGLLALLGCSEVPDEAPSASAPRHDASSFDASTTGAIRGRVVWEGDVLVAEPMIVKTIAFHPTLYKNPVHCTSPHYPRVHPENHGVAGAVVFLRGLDAQKAKPWDHADARVEFHDRQMHIHQGKCTSSVGFVKAGGEIEIVNRSSNFHLLRGRGAAFFGAPLPRPDVPNRRTLPKAGVVDLTDFAGYYWLHAHLFVADHPYYVQTDADGRFQLDQVPAGKYELVCWMPSWVVTRRELDPETGVLVRLIWADPVEQTRAIELEQAGLANLDFSWRRQQFAEGAK